MLNHLFLTFENTELNSFKIKHIQYNIYKRLNAFKYLTYKRIDISLKETINKIEIQRDDTKSASLICPIDPGILNNLSDRNTIIEMYKDILNCLKSLWSKNNWDAEDLGIIYNEIKKEDFRSCMVYGKTLSSPDKKNKAEFYCELYPEYTNYYVRFVGRQNTIVRTVLFLKGHQEPFIIFSFYTDRRWHSNEQFSISFNKEIFYVFNINNDDFFIDYYPIDNTLEELKNYVKAYQAGVTK